MMWLPITIVFIAVATSLFLFALRTFSTWYFYQRSWQMLPILVKDADEEVKGHTHCRECGEALLIAAYSIGYSSSDGRERFAKWGRCVHWRWWNPLNSHARRAAYDARKKSTSSAYADFLTWDAFKYE